MAGWRLTFTHGFIWSGHRALDPPQEECTWDWSYDNTATVTATLSSPTTADGCVIWTGNLSNLTQSILFHERQAQTCPEGTIYESIADGLALTDPPSLKICLSSPPEYILQGGTIGGSYTFLGSTFQGGGPSLGVIVRTNLPASGFVIADSTNMWTGDAWVMIPPGNPVMGRSPNTAFSWRLDPILEELEVIVEPGAYTNWIPKGNLGLPAHRGNSIAVTAKLQKKGGGGPQARADHFEFELVNVSKEPGVCMNFPVKNASDEPDLRFEDELNQPEPNAGNTVDAALIRVFKLDEGLLVAEATVSSFDFGAYGEIRVTAHVPGYDPIVGHLKPSW